MTLCAIMGVTIFVMEKQLMDIIIPVYEALECTCIKTGPKCVEALKFDFDFWYKYWKVTVPAIFTEVAQLKANPAAHSVNFAAAAAGSVTTYAAGRPERVLSAVHHLKHRLTSKWRSESSSSLVKP